MLSKRPIFIVRLEARERKKDRLGEGEIVTPTNWGHRQVRPHIELSLKQARLPQEGVPRGREIKGVSVPERDRDEK